MKTVYSASNISLVSIFQSILEGHGISCRLKNEFLVSGMGELPPIECWPQLCVAEDDFARAQQIVAEALSDHVKPTWECASCNEVLEGQFAACWKCGTNRPP